jgi:hypothetical protein
MINARARIQAHLNHFNMTTTEPTTAAEPATEPTKEKENVFLGLYFPADLKAKVAAAAKADERSMSQFAVRVFKNYFDQNPVAA